MRSLAKLCGKMGSSVKMQQKQLKVANKQNQADAENKLVNGVGCCILHFLELLLLFVAVVFNNNPSTII